MNITIGSIVKVKKGYRPNEKDNWFFEECDKYGYLFLVIGMDVYDFIDYTIAPLYKEPESDYINIGIGINIMDTDIELIEITQDKLINRLNAIKSELSQNWM